MKGEESRIDLATGEERTGGREASNVETELMTAATLGLPVEGLVTEALEDGVAQAVRAVETLSRPALGGP